jgi:hypothetical protein
MSRRAVRLHERPGYRLQGTKPIICSRRCFVSVDMSRTYSRKAAVAPEQFADDSGASPVVSQKRAKKTVSPAAARQALLDDSEFLLHGGGTEALDVAGTMRLVGHEQWGSVAAVLGPALAARLAARGTLDESLSPEEAACAAGLAPSAGAHAGVALLERASRSLERQGGRAACVALLEQEWAREGISEAAAEAIAAACEAGLEVGEEGWLALLERLGCARAGRAAVRSRGALLDGLAARLAARREEAVLRVLVNASNECAATAARLARTQAVLAAVRAAAEERLAATPGSFDALLLALALGVNCCELSGRARQLARLLQLPSLLAALFRGAPRDQLEGNVLAGYCAVFLLACALHDEHNAAAAAAEVPGGLPLLCDAVRQFSHFQQSLGLLPASAAAAHDRLVKHFES